MMAFHALVIPRARGLR